MRRSNPVSLIGVTLVGFAVAAACFAPTEAARAGEPAKPMKKIVFVLGQSTISANDIFNCTLPRELGYFAQEGLDVEIQTISTAGQIMQLLTAGRAQVTMTAAVALYTARAQGLPVKAIYNYLRKHATGIAVLESSPIKRPQDLKGKTIGIGSQGSARALDGRAMVRAAGLDPDKDVQWQITGIGMQALIAMQQGRVDALSLWNGTYADMENAGAKLRYFTFPFQDGLFSYLVQSTDEYVQKNPEVIVGVGRAIAKTTIFARTNPRAAVRIHLKAFPVPTAANQDKLFQDALNVMNVNLRDAEMEPGVTSFGSFKKADWIKGMNYYTELGLLKSKLNVDDLFVSDALNKKMNEFDRAAVEKQAREWKE